MRAFSHSWLVPAYLFLCLVLGGASAAGFIANLVLQLLAIPILFFAFVRHRATPILRPTKQLLVLAALMILLGILQFVPMPPAIWTHLPGRERIAEAYGLLEQPLPWLPISLAPRNAASSLLWLLPAIAVLVGIVRLGAYKAAWIGWAVLLVTAIAVLLGTLQISGDGHSWYLYRITNYGVMVGFFSNANHMATLLVCSVPFAAGLYMDARAKSRERQRSAGIMLILLGFFFLVVVGLFINASLAGLGLIVPVSAASFMLARRMRRPPVWMLVVLGLLTAASVGLVFSGRFDNNLTGASRTQVESRRTIFTNSFEAIKDHLPFGSGVGTFQPVYRTYENPETVTSVYINHAHSDFIEVVMETGLFGAALILLFLIWWGHRTVRIWTAADPDWLARSATVASGAIIAHSLVDYPLRTAAISALFAACCALMADPRAKGQRPRAAAVQKRPSRHLEAE